MRARTVNRAAWADFLLANAADPATRMDASLLLSAKNCPQPFALSILTQPDLRGMTKMVCWLASWCTNQQTIQLT
jgi:hypothetical protein